MNSISDALWEKIEWIVSKPGKRRGRPGTNPRKVLDGILFILDSGAKWRNLPREYGPKSTIHGWFRRWVDEGIFGIIIEYARELYFAEMKNAKWFAIDATHIKAPFANFSGKSPVDRGKRGVKRTIIVDWRSEPVAVVVGAGNMHDSRFFEPAFAQLKPQKESQILVADSAYDDKKFTKICRDANFAFFPTPNQRRSKKVSPKIRPSYRWKVEPTHAWFSWKRGLKTCWCKLQKNYLALCEFFAAMRLFKRLGFFG